MSALRNYEVRQPKQQPEQPKVRRVVKKVEPVQKKKFYTVRNLLILGGLMTFGILFGQLWLDSQATAVHAEAQNLRNQIIQQYELNSQMQSEIRELSSYTRVMEIATAHGLEVQENNIVFSD